MSDWYIPLLAGAGGVYLLAMGWLRTGIRRRRPDAVDQTLSVTVVVAARNEEAHIAGCIRALAAQDYAGDYQVVVVDDCSDDATRRIAEAEAGGSARRVEVVGAAEAPRFRCRKKSALAAGIEVAGGELLLFTDADCRPAAGWVCSTVRGFAPHIGLVAGFAHDADHSSLWRRLLGLENLLVAALGAGSIGMGRPLSCTGRNLACRRAVYDQVEGYAAIGHLIGGDDVYFARQVADRTSWGMVFNDEPESVVVSGRDSGGWVHRKLRHAGKAGHYRGGALVLGAVVYLFHLLLAVGLVAGSQGSALVWPALIALAAKMVVDAGVGHAFTRRLPGRELLRYLPLMELLYIPYVLLFTVAGRLGLFRWKA